MGLDICGQNIRITYVNGIPNGQAKINKNLGSQQIQLQWASIFLDRISRLHMKIILQTDRSRLIKNWGRRKNNYNGPRYLRQNITITYGNHIPNGQIKVRKIWDRKKYDYNGPLYFWPEYTDYKRKWYSKRTWQN